MQINFGKETRDVLVDHRYDIADISWIGNLEYCLNITNFFEKADQCNYDNGYGSQHMPVDIVIVMKDGSYFSRREYDGSEWWYYNKVPQKPKRVAKIKSFNTNHAGWLPLEDFIN